MDKLFGTKKCREIIVIQWPQLILFYRLKKENVLVRLKKGLIIMCCISNSNKLHKFKKSILFSFPALLNFCLHHCNNQSFNPYRGICDNQSFNPNRGICNNQPFNPNRGICNNQSFNPNRGICDNQSFNPNMGICDNQPFNPNRGICNNQSFNPNRGICNNQSFNPNWGLFMFNVIWANNGTGTVNDVGYSSGPILPPPNTN